MVACPKCLARFASSREAEREWFERHLRRSHDARRRRVDAGSRGVRDEPPAYTWHFRT